MLFNTFQFLVFYLAVAPVALAMPPRYRWGFLLAASYYFYMCWNPPYVAVIWAITIIDYLAGIRIEQSDSPQRRKMWLLVSLCANFGILFLFKYFNFAARSFENVSAIFHVPLSLPHVSWLLPVGISFHTFQAVSYTIEVYRGRFPAERHLGRYALYVAFFPQMVAGPIERPFTLLPQIHKPRPFEHARLRTGLELILWGLYKKLIVADSLAVITNRIYATPRQFAGGFLIMAVVGFTIQIYADFSGYSDMAVGLARILGYDLTINFKQPFFSHSIAEFWRRWHISLSSWFRDYLYLPLGGNKPPAWVWAIRVMFVFLISGLWHGSQWNYVIWGGIHGVFVVLGRAFQPVRDFVAYWSGIGRLPAVRRPLQAAITFSLFALSLVFFRAQSIGDAVYVLSHFFRIGSFRMTDMFLAGLPPFELLVVILASLLLFAVELVQTHPQALVNRMWEIRWLRWPVYATCFYSLAFFGVFERIEFIYFQF